MTAESKKGDEPIERDAADPAPPPNFANRVVGASLAPAARSGDAVGHPGASPSAMIEWPRAADGAQLRELGLAESSRPAATATAEDRAHDAGPAAFVGPRLCPAEPELGDWSEGRANAIEQANLELAFAIGGMSYVAIDLKRGLIEGGPLLEKLLAARPDQSGWRLADLLEMLDEADALRLRAALGGAGSGEAALDEELTLAEHDELLAVRLVGRLDDKGERRFAGIVADITERRRSEDLLNRRAADLAAANRQLEQFTHLVSHDLKSPLRGVHHIASFLRDDLGEQASPEVLSHLDRLERQIAKMSRMLDDLQAYAHADRTAGRSEMVDIAALVVELGELLGLPDGIRLEVDAEPSRVTTDRTALALILRNLIDNGAKHHDRASGRIMVRARREARGRMKFIVADDGPGIPAAQRKQVFEFFRTTGGKGAGSGMGLAFVRRAVQRHGGRIWIEDAPAGIATAGRGVAFVFNWPLHTERASGRRSR